MERVIEETQSFPRDDVAINRNVDGFWQSFDGNRARKNENTPLEAVAVAKSVEEDEAGSGPKGHDHDPENKRSIAGEQHGFNLAYFAPPQQGAPSVSKEGSFSAKL